MKKRSERKERKNCHMDDSVNLDEKREDEDTEMLSETAEEVSAPVAENTGCAEETEQNVREQMEKSLRNPSDPIAEVGEVNRTGETDEKEVRKVFPGENRNLSAEYAELVHAHPELVGNGIPEDIYEEMKASERPVLSVYDSCMLKKQTERISQLEEELAQLRQNAETASRAPVTGTSGGSVPEEKGEDPFIRAFRNYR